MAGGPFGLNGPQMIDPIELMKMRVVNSQGQPAQAPVPAVSPPVAPSSPAAAPAVSGPPAGGGGGGVGGIGSAISRALSGEGLFGSSSPDDDEIDPVTGAPRGLSRRANMQSLMKVGIMLMAAGQAQSPDSRARVLAGIAGATDDANNQINNFARNRLEMAKTKLLERQTLQDQAAQTALLATAGIGPSAGGSPVATGAPPGTVAPPAPVVGAPPAPVGGEGPVPGVPAPPNPETGVGGAGTPVPAAPRTATVTPPPSETPRTPPATPNTMTTTAPGLPELKPWAADDQQRAIILATPPAQRAGVIEEMRRRYETQDRSSNPYRVPGVGTVIDIYKGNQKVETKKLTDGPVHMVDIPGPDDTVIRETRDEMGNVIKRDTVRDVRADKAYDMTITSAQKESEELRERYRDNAAPAQNYYDKIVGLQDLVREGKINAGKLANVQDWVVGWIGSTGTATKADIEKLVNSRAISAELGNAAGKFAKENYGPSVSDQDRKVAQELLGALNTGTPEEIDAALGRVRDLERSKIEKYNQYSTDYNERTKGLKGFDRNFYGAKTINKEFREPKPWVQGAGASSATGAPPPAATPAPTDMPDNLSEDDKLNWDLYPPEIKDILKRRASGNGNN